MGQKKIQFPAKGRIKATGSPVEIIGETNEGGIPCYVVIFRIGDPMPVSWSKSQVIVERA